MLRRIYPLVVLLVFADVVKKASCTEKGSLTFVIDDTLSMDDDIYYVKRSMDWIMDTVFKNNSTMISNMVLVTFNNSDARVRVVAQNQCDFDKALKEVSAHSKDYPEVLSMTGLILALKESNYGSYIYVFTDASAKDHDNVHIVKQLCQEKQSQISFVITAANNTLHYRDKKKAVYHDIAQACSGLAYEVSKPEVSEILKPIRYIVGGENILVVQASFPDDVPKHNYVQFEVDKLTEFYIVSTVGKNVKFAWQSTKRYKAWWDLKSTIVDEENCKVDKIVKKTPGKYTLSVFSEKKTSLMLVGRSKFIFKHGFSELKPQSINDTFLQPIANAKVHLSILVSDKHQQVEITEAQILGMNDKQITPNLTLTKISKDFYVTSPLVTPTQMFKIVVIGKLNATGQSIKRFTKIPITPIKLPDNQALTVMIVEGKEMSVEYNSSLKLTCKVTAFPIPKISWLNKQGQHLASNTSMIEYPYEYISYLEMPVAKEDSYMCSVINDIGLKNSSIRVEVKDPFTVVNTPKRLKVPYGKSGALKCDIKSTLPMDIHWYHVDDMAGIKKKLTDSNDYSISVDKTELTIIKMDLYLTGKYVCNAYLKHNKDVKKDFSKLVEVTGLVVPNVQAQSKVTVIKGSTAVLKCNVSGVPMPTIEWHYEDNSGSKVTVRSPAGTESTLLITNAKRNNEGQYKCLAENVLDKDEKVTTLIVQEKPQLAGVDANKVILGMPVDIECRIVEGWPKPNITWFMEISDKNFTTIAETGEMIHIAKAENNHTGRYRCVAQNEIGSAEHFTSLTVESQPEILTKTKSVEAIEGDIAIKIPCEVVGVPQPAITWKVNETIIKPSTDTKYYIDNGSLIIQNPNKTDIGKYICEAKNYLGSTNATIEVTFAKRPSNFGATHFVYILYGESKKIECDAYHSKSQSLKWFDSEGELDKKFIEITNASVSNDGNYICHVSDKQGHTETHTYIVNVGGPPKLLGDNTIPLNDWRGDVQQIHSNCDSDAKPKAKVQWKHNGKVVPENDVQDLAVIYSWGHYTCNVTNPHGSVLKEFHVKSSSVCLLPKNSVYAEYMPVIVTEDGTWPTKKTLKYFFVIERDEVITLYCPNRTDAPNYFSKFPTKSEIKANCFKEDMFVVEAETHKVSDLQCILLTNKSGRLTGWFKSGGLLESFEVCFYFFLLFIYHYL